MPMEAKQVAELKRLRVDHDRCAEGVLTFLGEERVLRILHLGNSFEHVSLPLEPVAPEETERIHVEPADHEFFCVGAACKADQFEHGKFLSGGANAFRERAVNPYGQPSATMRE